MKFNDSYILGILTSLEWRPGLLIKRIPIGISVSAGDFDIHIICDHAHIEIGTHKNKEYKLVTYIPVPCLKTVAFSHCLKYVLDQIINHGTDTI